VKLSLPSPRKLLRRSFVAALSMSAILVAAPLRAADDKDGPTYTDPAKAGEDFNIQGEYVGVIEADGGQNWGAQVIALGNGEFTIVGFPGGLPGDGYRVGDEKRTTKGSRRNGSVFFEDDDFSAEIASGQITIKSSDGDTLGTLMRVQRESPTLGQKPPEGALVLFDGSSADKWVGGKMTEENYLQADTHSQQKFGDHFMHIEFRTPFRPNARGQARGNSGVYVQSRYEVQVLDSFGLKGEDNECGGIYQIAKPKVNMCYPPLSWQTYDIDFKAARYDSEGKKTAPAEVTIRHNGVLIHENLKLPNHTPGRLQEANSDEPVYLQGHGNPVVYRNIWVVLPGKK
jgi:hypothetical protein